MKTLYNLRQFVPVLFVSFVLFASLPEVNAQNHRGNGKNDNDRKEYRQSDRFEKKSDNHYKNKNEVKRDKYYKSNEYRHDYRPKYTQKHKHLNRNYFDHPQYGRVYNKFDRSPVVFKHHRGDYYYYGNNFYRYNRGIGYCVTEPPRNVYFSHLPVNCNRIRINGHLFFRHGDIFFTHSSRGYVIVPSPVDIQLTVRF